MMRSMASISSDAVVSSANDATTAPNLANTKTVEVRPPAVLALNLDDRVATYEATAISPRYASRITGLTRISAAVPLSTTCPVCST